MTEPAPNFMNGKPRRHLEPAIASSDTLGHDVYEERLFLKMLCLERKRTERSNRGFVLMIMESASLLKSNRTGLLEKVINTLSQSTRETDIKGWYQDRSTFGVIFTEMGSVDGGAVAKAILGRMMQVLSRFLSLDEINELRLSFHVFPESTDHKGGPIDLALYPELKSRPRLSHVVKRGMDIAGSLCAMVLFSPILFVIAVLVKATSKGPVFFKQDRVGKGGKRFTFYKFRSMYFSNDHAIHQEYVKRLIAGEDDTYLTNGKENVYKLTHDPRVTPVGRFLRRTSLDEVPQFFNVLKGEMSIVGPRPPVPYEFEQYNLWHRARLFSVKPGITGLWQVRGRSKVRFDDMVRMDLEYARTWSPWLDLKIMLRTPLVLISGEGGY